MNRWKSLHRRQWYQLGAGTGLLILISGVIWFGFFHKKPELTVLVEANGVIDPFVRAHLSELERTTGMKLHLKTFVHDQVEDGDARTLLESALVIAGADVFAQWKAKGWLATLPPANAGEKPKESQPLFAWGRPYAVSTRKELNFTNAMDLFKEPKADATARFSITYGTDHPRFLLNLLVNAGALQVNGDSDNATPGWDAEKLLETLTGLSKAVHEDLTAPVSCVFDCPLSELLRGNASIAWVDHTTAVRIQQHLEKTLPAKNLQPVQSLEPMKGKALVDKALLARPKLSPDANLSLTQELIAALTSQDLIDDFGPALLEPISSDTVQWDLQKAEHRQFEVDATAALIELVEGQATPSQTRDRLMTLARN